MKTTEHHQINTPSYWDTIYSTERGSGKQRLDSERLEFIAAHLGNSGSFLDVGCGNGEAMARLKATHPTVSFVGTDIGNGTINNCMIDHPGMDFVVGNAESLPFVNNTFDVVWCGETLEHVSDPSKALTELFRVSKGLVIISVPSRHRNTSDEHITEFDLMDFVSIPFELIDLDVVCNGISQIGCWRKS